MAGSKKKNTTVKNKKTGVNPQKTQQKPTKKTTSTVKANTSANKGSSRRTYATTNQQKNKKQLTQNAQKKDNSFMAEVPNLMRGALQQSVGDTRSAVAGTMDKLIDDNRKNTTGTGGVANRLGNTGVSRKGSNDRRTVQQKQEQKEARQESTQSINKVMQAQKAGAKRGAELGSKQSQKGAKRVEESKKGMTEGEKWLADIVVGGTQMAADMAVGALTGGGAMAGRALTQAALFTRAYGGSMNSASQEGASDAQAMAKGLATGTAEVLIERLGAVAGVLQKSFGKGIADDLVGRAMDKVVKNIKNQGLKDLTYSGGKLAASALFEGLEEMVAEGLDPILANQIYAKTLYAEKNQEVQDEIATLYNEYRQDLAQQIDALGLSEEESAMLYNKYLEEYNLTDADMAKAFEEYAVKNPHKVNLKDMLYAGSIGATLGGTAGAVSSVTDYREGKKISDMATELFGEDGINVLIEKARNIDEDKGGSLRAETYKELVKSGGGLAMGQVAEMARAVEAQRVRDENRFLDADNAANREIKERDLDGIYEVDKNGEVGLTENAQGIFNENLKSNVDTIKKMQLPEMTEEQVRGVAEVIASVQTGIAMPEDVSLFTLRNPENRAIFEEVTGVKLPETNQETKTMLFEMVVENRIKAAESQTAWRKDTVRGMLLQDIAPAYGSAGQGVIIDNVDTINADDPDDAEMLLMGFDNAYNSGRAGISYKEYLDMFKDTYVNVPKEIRHAAYRAGLEDRGRAYASAEAVQLKLGRKVEKSRSQAKSVAHRGKLTVNLAPENKGKFGAQEQIFYKAIASAMNIEIRIVDNLGSNGTYTDGIITMDVNGDRNLGYIFFHELTHHLEKYAPKEYQILKETLRKRWIEKDEAGYRTALEQKKSQYARQNIKLTDEMAFDEILADGTYEFLQDESFMNELCKKERGVAQALLDAIRMLINKIRAILVNGDRFTPKQNEALYSELDILKEMESLWADALAKAVQNRSAVGTVSEMESVAKTENTYWLNSEAEVKNVLKRIDNVDLDFSEGHISIGRIPPIYSELFEIGELELVIAPRHTFNLLNSKESAIKKGLYRKKGGDHYRNMSVDELYEEIVSLEEPLAIYDNWKELAETGAKVKTPRVLMLLKSGRLGVIEFYGNKEIANSDTRRNHGMVTIFEKNDLQEYLNRKEIQDRLLHIKSSDETEVPNSLRVNDINASELDDRLAQFNEKLNTYKRNRKINYSLPDTEYMTAVENGDMETAQRMVDEAAEQAMKHSAIRDNKGKLLKVYHGTNARFNSFNDPNHTPYGEQGNFYFSPWRSKSEEYGDNVRAFYLNIEVPRLYDENFNELNPDAEGIDGFIFIPEDIENDIDQSKQGDTEIVAYYPDQIKSADPVTYDDNGNVIPLSERFDVTNDDIRYSVPDTDSTGRELSDGQKSYFANSKARDKEGRLVPVFHTTPYAGFTEFNSRFSDDQRSFFFSDNISMSMSYARNPVKAFTSKVETLDDLKKLLAVNEDTPARGMLEFEAWDADWNVLYGDLNEYIEAFENGEAVNVAHFSIQGMSDDVSSVEADVVENATTAEKSLGILIEEANNNLNELIMDEGYYEVYLNLENPLIIDGAEQNWDEIEGYADNELTLGTKSIEEAYDTVESLENLLGNSYQHVTQEADDTYVYYEYDMSEGEYIEELRTADFEEMRDYILKEVADPDDVESSLKETHNTRGWAEIAYELGHDGVIFKNIYDNGTHGYIPEAGDVYVAFSPEQIKSVDNLNPTEDPDIRFSLKEPVEETKDLIAVHNIHEHKLLAAFKLGGFPMPSIAVTKDNVNHDGFGPISVLFDKSTIDPKANRYNRVYGGDAYTPTFPTVYYEASEKAVERISGKINEFYNMLPDFYQRDVRALRDSTNIEDQLNREGEDGFIEKYLKNYGLKQIYLAETSEIVPIAKKEVRREMTDYQKELYQKYIDSLGEEAIRSSKGAGISGRDWFDKYGEQIKTAYIEWVVEEHDFTEEEGREVVDSEKALYWVRQARYAADYLNTGGVEIDEIEDISSTKETIDEKINTEDFNAWVRELFDGIVEMSGIRNNKDIFTPSGNRRSFRATHDPVTIDNVVKAMRSEEQQTGGAFLGINNIGGASSREYKSIEDIKADAERLYEVDEAERKESEDYISETIEELGRRYANGKDYFDARNALVEAVSTNESRQGIAKYLKQYDYIYKYEESLVDELIELRDYIRSLPTTYFEAKPRRAVTFDEIKAVIIPDDCSAELKTALDEKGIEYNEYEAGNEEDRKAKVNDAATEKNVRFSLSDEDIRDCEKNKVKLSKRDYAIIRKEVVRKNAHILNADETMIDYAYTDNLFVMYLTYGDDLFTPFIKIRIEGNEDIIGGIIGEFRSNEERTYSRIEDAWNRRRSGSRNSAIDGDRRKSKRADRMDRGQHRDGGQATDSSSGGKDIRKDGSGQVRWSLTDSDDINNYINETEFVEVPPVRDYEKEFARVKDQSVGELKKQVEKLQAQTKLTHGKVLDPKSVAEEINMLIKALLSYNEGTKKTDHKLIKLVQENAKSIYTDVKNGNIEDAAVRAWDVATEVIENLQLINDEAYQEYKDLRNYLRQTKINFPEGFPHQKEFRADNMGRLKLVNEGGKSVDDVYQELLGLYPGMFDETIDNVEDQLQEIADVRASLEPYDIVLSEEETNQLIKETAHDILDIAVHGKPWKSWADRQAEIYDERTKKLKARHKEALRDVRAKMKDKADERVKAEKEKAKEKVKAERQKGKDKLAEQKKAQQESNERKKAVAEKRRLIDRVEKDLKWLSDRLLKPTDDKHLPDGYQKAIAELLVMVDPQTARSKKLEEKYGISKKRANFLKLKAEYENIAKSESEGMIYNDDISKWCDALAETLDDAGSIAEATVEEMRTISMLIRAITHSIRKQNDAFDENLKAGIAESARETIHKAKTSRKTGQRGGIPGALGTLLNESMVTPRDFFEGIGGGIHKAFMSIRKGHDKHVDNITEAREFFAGLFGQYANKKKPGSAIEDWRSHKTNETFKLDGGTITMNIAQRMALYCSLKREQAAGHIYGSGIVVAEASTMTKLKEALGAKKEINYGTTRITMEEAYDIVSTLSSEQIEMADKLQEFLNGRCAEWGNETSLKMFGYKKFTEQNYFPIKSADVYLDSNFEGRQTVERIRNFGFTKGTVVNANNPIVIDDIFTVVADHVNKMSMYNAFAAPIADFTRVYNFKSRDDSGLIIESTKDVLANTYGKKVGRYITNFIADLQSNTQTRQEGFTRFVNKTLANYKKASIAANLRVAMQQPTALIRAFTLIDPKYFILKNHTPELLKKARGEDTNYKDMLEHCPIARWKSWGFSQVDMARDIDDIMMNKEWSRLDLVTMQVYGVLDLYTWSKIWGAVRAEVKAKHPDVEVDSEEYYALCNERASEIFDKTQVVDSVVHKSQVMRNTDTMSKVLTSFMAEPTRTYNMVRSEYAQAMDMWANGDKAKATAKVARASSVYLLNALACAAAAAVADALRGKDLDGDDEEEEWWELTLANFMSNANPLNLLPVFKEVSSIWKGWDTSNMALEGIEALVKAEKGLFDKMMGDSDKSWSELLRKQAEAMGMVFGVPVKNILREIESFGKIVGLDVFAAEAGEEEEKMLDLNLIRNGSKFDNFLNGIGINLSEREKLNRNFDGTVKSLNRATKNMTEAEKQEYLWKEITKGYTTEIEAGNYVAIDNMRRLLKATGGDYEKFNESVISKTKTAMKKTIGVDVATTEEYRYQLRRLGLTDAVINQEVVMKSDAAKAFQLEACEDDYDGMVKTIEVLYNAGLTEIDLDVLYYNRTKAINANDYRTGSLIAPCNGEITSTFGYRDVPIAGASSNHQGLDIAVAANSDIVAADGGKVSSVGYNSGYGHYVKISHGNGRYTFYAHLNGYYVQKGQAVSKGEVIALSGSTGVSTGPHLHFEVIENGVNVDPLPYLQ